MMNAMNKVLRDFIPKKNMPFLNDISIKECVEEKKDETMDVKGCRRFVANHIEDCNKFLLRLEEVHLTLSGIKSMFGVKKVLVVRYVCGPYGWCPHIN